MILAIVVAVTTVLAQRPADIGSADATRAGSPAVAAPAELRELRDYARAHNLTGLFPAGLARRDSAPIATYEVYRDVARYAHANGLTGLSPASLAPVTRRLSQ